MMRESKRNNIPYRRFALARLGEFIDFTPDTDWFGEVASFIQSTVEELLENAEEMDVDSKKSSEASSRTL